MAQRSISYKKKENKALEKDEGNPFKSMYS
jgi:hypothetical protein